MAKFDLVFKESVFRDLTDIPKQDIQRVLERIDLLREEPRPPGSVKFSGREFNAQC